MVADISISSESLGSAPKTSSRRSRRMIYQHIISSQFAASQSLKRRTQESKLKSKNNSNK